MDLDDTPDLAAYRATVRTWLEAHASEAPPARSANRRPGEPHVDDEAWIVARRGWQNRLAEGGLVAVTWPAEYGGAGLGPLEQLVVNQEIDRAGVPGVFDIIGVGQLGPALIAHGSESQKRRHLGPMLTADEVWCQLFSEPAAGSDLAAVQARAHREGDGSWRLSGQKVWTTNAHFASFGLMLARTSPHKPKHEGLTMFIVPMDNAGVTVRPLRQISGAAHFNEVFLDDVALDPGAEVGPVDGGWSVALTTLMFERSNAWGSAAGFGWHVDRFTRALVEDADCTSDPLARRRFGEIASELIALRFTGYRMLTSLQHGQIPGVEGALAKITTIRAATAAAELMCDVLGPAGLDDAHFGDLVSDLPGLEAAGGTDEILRNLVGERVLGLPPEPRLDKGVPFDELRRRQDAA